jgi:hypothetical protein
MFQNKVLIIERLQPIDTGRARSVAIQEVASLAHEILDLSIHNSISITSYTNPIPSYITSFSRAK